MAGYVYTDVARDDILKMIPADGQIIGTVGCGYSATEAELVKKGRTVYGADIAPEVETIARKRLNRFDLIKPGDPLPWAKRSLDGLLLADVIEHIPLAWESLKEWSTYVRPGGWVAVSVPNMRNFAVMGRFIWTGDWPERDSGIFDRTHIQMMSRKRLLRWCQNAGLELERIHDSFGSPGTRRKVFRTFDFCTFKLFHSWIMYQVQVVCRVKTAGAGETHG